MAEIKGHSPPALTSSRPWPPCWLPPPPPSSSLVQRLAEQVSGTGAVTCTDDEKTTLVGQTARLATAADAVQQVVDNLLASIEASTGVTPPASALTVPPSTAASTQAVRLRRDKLVRDLLGKMNNY